MKYPFRGTFECMECGDEICLGLQARCTEVTRHCESCDENEATFKLSGEIEAVD